jgi:hypothetical protein
VNTLARLAWPPDQIDDGIGVGHFAIRQDDELQWPLRTAGLTEHELERRQDLGSTERRAHRIHVLTGRRQAVLVVSLAPVEQCLETRAETYDVE